MKPMNDLMFELEKVLRAHAQRYPLMQPTDAVKLIYQNEFGGGHLIIDAQSCLNYLRREYASLSKDPSATLWEDIGNGIIRVNLAAVREEDLEHLGQVFLRSAAAHSGRLDMFLEKLGTLRMLTKEGLFTFSSEALEAYLDSYQTAGYPAVSHSEQYRKAYQPAYRVVYRNLYL